MSRFPMPLTLVVLVCALVCAPAGADDPPKKLTPEERKELEAKVDRLYDDGIKALMAGRRAEAGRLFEEQLATARRLYPATEFPDGHPRLANALSGLGDYYNSQGRHADAETVLADALAMNRRLRGGDHESVGAVLGSLGLMYKSLGRPADAEPFLRDALVMYTRLFKGDHPRVSTATGHLGALYVDQGKLTAAEPLFKAALAMNRRLFKGDHAFVAMDLINLGLLYQMLGRPAEAEALAAEALAMYKRLYKGDHPGVAAALSQRAALFFFRGKYADAEGAFRDALAMVERLHKGDHPDVVGHLKQLGLAYELQGKWAEAEPPYRKALDMARRLYRGDHPGVAAAAADVGRACYGQERYADAAPLLDEAVGMFRRLFVRSVRDRPEGDALTLLARNPAARDAYLLNARAGGTPAPEAYSRAWDDKGFVARMYEQRLRHARAASGSAPREYAELADARRRRAAALLVPVTSDPAAVRKRNADVAACDARVAELVGRLDALAPAADRLAPRPADLQKALPVSTAVVDYVRVARYKPFTDDPGAYVYLAFVVTKDTIAWVDLGTAAAIEPAVDAWRDGITAGKVIPDAMPAKVRELVWEKVRKELPANIKTVYVCPDAALCKLPFAALPGDKPNTVLLDDFAIATIPHAPFLLDKLWPQDKPTSNPTGALVVGGVKYDAAVAPPAKGAPAPGPLVKPDAKLVWKALPNTVGEAAGVAGAAERKKLAPTRLDGEQATSAAVLAALPKAKVAHFATHGFFADPSFRGVFNLDPKDFEMRGGERVGRVVNSPLLMTGLVFAGANDPKAPGRGILTGEQLIDLDLSGLELAVLSACETGLGDVADGQGVFGLQRAFHYAGATNVVCSLWKVPDEPTAALMGAFYANLWDKGLSPMEALRQAQLEIYRNPGKIPALAKGFRGVFEEVEGSKVEAKPGANGTAHPLLWAAFTLSGPGK